MVIAEPKDVSPGSPDTTYTKGIGTWRLRIYRYKGRALKGVKGHYKVRALYKEAEVTIRSGHYIRRQRSL